MISHCAEGFILGLGTGLQCFATCGAIYAPFLMQKDRSWGRSFTDLLVMSGGRFITYLALGAIAGLAGQQVTFLNRTWFTIAAYAGFSTMLIVSAVSTHRGESGCRIGRLARLGNNPFLLGLVSGVNFCPSLLLAISKASTMSGPLGGMAMFAAFFVGTNLYLMPLAVFGVMGNKKLMRTIARSSAVAVGVWFIVQAALMAMQQVRRHTTLQTDGSVVTMLDSLPATLVVCDTLRWQPVALRLAHHRLGRLDLVTTQGALPDSGYLFVDAQWQSCSAHDPRDLKMPRRFVVVLPDWPREMSDSVYVHKLVAFWSSHHFVFRLATGAYFDMRSFVVPDGNQGTSPVVGKTVKIK